MDRIKNLSLDQKAKLYYMALLQKGMIDTLPEDPKAAYIQSMMDEPASSKFSEPMGEDHSDAENEKLKKISKELNKASKMHKGQADKIAKITNETNNPEDDAEQAEYDKGWYGESLKEIASELGYLKEEYNMDLMRYHGGDRDKAAIDAYEKEYKKTEVSEVDGMEGGIDLNAISAKKASFVYTEQGGRFYSLTLSTSDGQTLKMKYDEANEWLKDTLSYIHEGDLIPRRYNSGLEDLDLIVARLEELGIEASHGDYMDVS